MSDWRETTLDRVVTFQRGHDLTVAAIVDGNHPVAGSNGIIGYHNKFTTEGPGITLGRSGNSIGVAHYYENNFWAHNTTLYSKAFFESLPKYVFYFLKTIDFAVLNSGSAVPSLNRNHIHNIRVKVPPLPEQKAIAAILSSLDEKIDLLHRQNKTLEAIAETLFRQWFIEEAQEDWEEKSLGELVTITSSKRIFYSEYVDTGVPFYRSKEIIELSTSGSTKSELYITEERFHDIEKRFGSPLEGDILLTSVGTLGIPYRVKNRDRFYFKDGNLTWFRDFGSIPSIIIFCWLKSSIGKEQLESITIGSTQAALTISGLKEIQLTIPPQNLMKDLEVKLIHIYNKVDLNQSQICTLEKLRDTLLPKLMSGEVRVSY